nr:uncharacterized protein LOC123276121 [Equus asinus]
MDRVCLESHEKRGSESSPPCGPQLPVGRHWRQASGSKSLKVSGEGRRNWRPRLPGEGKHAGLGGEPLQYECGAGGRAGEGARSPLCRVAHASVPRPPAGAREAHSPFPRRRGPRARAPPPPLRASLRRKLAAGKELGAATGRGGGGRGCSRSRVGAGEAGALQTEQVQPAGPRAPLGPLAGG